MEEHIQNSEALVECGGAAYFGQFWSTLTSMIKISTRSPDSSVSSEQDSRDEERCRARQHADNLKQKRREIAQLRHQRELAELTAVQTKRDQWKAASARYYEHHPEVKEKKRQKMVEQCAAKKLARRHWDPPKLPKKAKSSGLAPDERTPSVEHRPRPSLLGEFTEHADIDLSPDELDSLATYEHLSDDWINPRTLPCRVHDPEQAATESLLSLSAEFSDAHAAVPLGSYTDAPRQQPEANQGSHGRRMVEDAWGVLAPDYDSSDDD
ncbi:hypothetical protein B0H13DRAFT_1880219 [Mycena leptocephala]|nr:hypothetical protein B0H13DRAFT_1880219 [Mycena leptocephala]